MMKSPLIAAGLLAAAIQTASADPTVLRFVPGQSPGTFAYDDFYVPWSKKIGDDSHGTLSIDLRGGTSIANITNMYDRVMGDVVQIGFVLFNYVQGKFPFSEVAALPNTAPDAEQGSVALWRLYQSGALNAEFDQAKPLVVLALPQSLVHLRAAPKSLKDLTGEKIVAPTQMTALAAKYMGAQPITLSSPEAYEAINRGTADGTILSWNVYFSFKIGEVAHYHIDQSMGTAAGMIFMSKKVYDGLAPEAKKAIDENSGEAASRTFGKWWDGDNNKNREIAKKDTKQTVVTLDPETKAAWAQRLNGAIAEWSQSRPGIDNILAQYRRLLADVAAGK
ncbi:MAG TPA: TRAP transporter substrate-binding protein [Stellaceae bacterium]|jgi:TRAP-type C4-dicarboxylate transport system substrate-binding protein